MGTEAEVYAAEASDKNDLLENILPATVGDYIELVRAHINAGQCRFLLVYDSCNDRHISLIPAKLV